MKNRHEKLPILLYIRTPEIHLFAFCTITNILNFRLDDDYKIHNTKNNKNLKNDHTVREISLYRFKYVSVSNDCVSAFLFSLYLAYRCLFNTPSLCCNSF